MSNLKHRFVEVNTPGVVQITNLDELDQKDVLGCYVKVAILVKSSEREQFDSEDIRTRLKDRGALSVIIAPVIVPDIVNKEKAKPIEHDSPYRMVRNYVDELNLSSSESTDVMNLISGFMAEEGI